ncbi:MAG: hypothetical protein LBH75_05715 [Treponema sp.]|jgi:hypothetical protein|nr:hypothetical protein [Treponema sp.]
MTKKEIIEQVFDYYVSKGSLGFDNGFVKEILREAKSSTNPYDIITKVDDMSKLAIWRFFSAAFRYYGEAVA